MRFYFMVNKYFPFFHIYVNNLFTYVVSYIHSLLQMIHLHEVSKR